MVVKKKEIPENVTARNFFISPRRALYAFAWALLFSIATAELGLVSQQLHIGGNNYDNYGNMMFKHILGILLFSVILVYLLCIGHFSTTPLFMNFWVLVAAVFWGVGAGGVFQSSPYRKYNCGSNDPSSTFHGTRWGEPQFFSQCHRIVTIQGLAWAEWGLLVLMFFGMLIHNFDVKVRRTTFYGV